MSLFASLLCEPTLLNVAVAVRTDGLRGSGTLRDPFNGSTAAAFDRVMNSLAALGQPVRVHLGPGVFETRGYSDQVPDTGWQAFARLMLVGSGMDVTTLKLVGCTQDHAQYFAVGHALASGSGPGRVADFFEISRLTIDCNLRGQAGAAVACGAVRVKGTHSRLRRVKAVDWGTTSSVRPCHVFASITADPLSEKPRIFDTVIDGCLAVERNTAASSAVIVIHVGHKDGAVAFPEPKGESAVVRHCLIDGATAAGTVDLTKNVIGLSASWCHGLIFESNRIRNVRIGGPWQAEAQVPEAVVRNNSYTNVFQGPSFSLGALSSAIAISSIVKFPYTFMARVTTATTHGYTLGTRLKLSGGTPDTYDGYRQCTAPPLLEAYVTDPNKFDIYTPLAHADNTVGGTVQSVRGVENLLVEGNRFEMALPTGADPVPVGVRVDQAGAAFQPHEQVIVRNNRFRYLGGLTGAYEGLALSVTGARNVLVTGNRVETVPSNELPFSTENPPDASVGYFDNRTTTGRLLPRTDAEGRPIEELDGAVEDALVTACFER